MDMTFASTSDDIHMKGTKGSDDFSILTVKNVFLLKGCRCFYTPHPHIVVGFLSMDITLT